jgi:hypothetical protein
MKMKVNDPNARGFVAERAPFKRRPLPSTPIKFDGRLANELLGLGAVRHLVSPNQFHYAPQRGGARAASRPLGKPSRVGITASLVQALSGGAVQRGSHSPLQTQMARLCPAVGPQFPGGIVHR